MEVNLNTMFVSHRDGWEKPVSTVRCSDYIISEFYARRTLVLNNYFALNIKYLS